MALLNARTRMFHWKIYTIIQGTKTDRTDLLNPVLSSFKVTHGISSQKTQGKKASAPSELEMTITSNNYIENLFTEGVELEVWVGEDSLKLTKVFKGKIKQLPDGSARELLDYTVKAYGDEIKLSEEKKNTNFKAKKKSEIIIQIAERNKIVADATTVVIKDDNKPGAGFQKLQKDLTDTELLDKLTKEWGCSWWVRDNTLYFMDFSEIFVAGDKLDKTAKGLPYPLYYRSNLRSNNVETVKWTFSPPPGGSEDETIFNALTEFGADPNLSEYKVRYKGAYYKLREPYAAQIRSGQKTAFGAYALEAISQTAILNAEQVLHKFFVIEPDSKQKNRENIPDIGDNAGVEISIHLNVGDPGIFPPRSAELYSGTLGNNTGDTDLPNWMFRHGAENQTVAKLNIKETVLTFEQGMLKTELKCSMGVPAP
jgi:hypothetical protein